MEGEVEGEVEGGGKGREGEGREGRELQGQGVTSRAELPLPACWVSLRYRYVPSLSLTTRPIKSLRYVSVLGRGTLLDSCA